MLTAALSFVVQIDRGGEASRGELNGRVEHILSGTSDRFSSLRELEAFLRRFAAEEPER